MPIDIDRLNAEILEEDAQVKEPTGDFVFDASAVSEDPVQPELRVSSQQDVVQTNVPTIEGEEVEPAVNFDDTDSFYDVETDMIRPGASLAHRVNEQFFHGITDLSLDDPDAVKWDDQIDSQKEGFIKSLGGAAVGAGRGFLQTIDVINRGAIGLAMAGQELIEGTFGEERAESIGELFGDAYEALVAPNTTTPSGLNRKDFLSQFNVTALGGDSFALIDLAERARGRAGDPGLLGDAKDLFGREFTGLTTTEKNQIIAQFEQDALTRQIAMDSLSYSEQQQMLKHTADRWTHPDVPWLFGSTDIEMDAQTYFRRTISEAAVNEQWWKAVWLTAQQTTAQLAPAIASMWAGGSLAAINRGTAAAKAASVTQFAGVRFSPTLLKAAPKTGLTMAIITPGTAEEKLKTGAVMTAYASSGAVSELFGTWSRRWIADMAINTAASTVINPASEHMVEWGGMYREMYRQARYEADRLGLDTKNSNSLAALYFAGVAIPDAIFGAVAATSGRKIQPAVKQARIEYQAREHWLRGEWEGRLRQTNLTPEARESFLDNSMHLMATQADLQGTTIDDLFQKHFQADDDFGIRIRQTGGEIVAELQSSRLDFQPQVQRDGTRVDTNFGDPRAKALQDLVMYQRGLESQVEFLPAAVPPEAVAQHAEALNVSLTDGLKIYDQYAAHPEFGQWIKDNNIKSYDELLEVSYEGLRSDIDEAFPLLGVKVEVFDGPGQPYRNMAEAIRDMSVNRTLKIVKTEADHAQLGAGMGVKDGLTYLDKLKAIRLYFGHAGGSHDATHAGIRNAQARVSQMLSDPGNIAFATEGGLAAARFGHESLGVRDASLRVEDGTAPRHERPLPAPPPKRAVLFGNERVIENRSVTVLDNLVQKGDATQVVLQYVRDNPNADPKLFAETYAHHSSRVEEIQKRLDDAAAKGDFKALNDIAQELIDAQILQQSYREAAEFLTQAQGQPREIAPDLLEVNPGAQRAEAAILAPELADWRSGLVPKAEEGVLQRLLPELLRPIKRKISDNEAAVARKARVIQKSHSKNSPDVERAMDNILEKYKDQDISDLKVWENFWFDLTGDPDIPLFPEGFKQILDAGPAGISDLVRNMSAEQIKDFVDGIKTTEVIKEAYQKKEASLETTAYISLWGALSPGLNNYPHESAFMEVLLGNGRMKEWIGKAEEGTFNVDEYLQWVETFYPEGSGKAGAQAKKNMNSFGEKFLANMYRPLEEGKYKGERPIVVLHRLMSDPEVSGRQLRREWYHMLDPDMKVGIDIKVLSFMGLIAGKRDVIVIDRIQTQHLWDMEATYGYKNAYDGIEIPQKPVFNKDGTPKLDKKGRQVLTKKISTGMAQLLSGHRAVALYEKMEDQLRPIAGQGLSEAGLPFNDLGAWHWASWVQKGNQEVSHSTLVGLGRHMNGVEDPFVGTSVVSGKFNAFFYGFKNVYFGTRDADDFRHVYTTAKGEEFIMDRAAMVDLKKVGDLYKNTARLKVSGEPKLNPDGSPKLNKKGDQLFEKVDLYVTGSNKKRWKVENKDRIVPNKFTYTQEKTANGTTVPTDRPWTERDDVNLPNFDKWVERLGVRPDPREAEILASGSNQSGLARPRRGGVDELKDSGGALAQEQPGAGLQGATAFFKNGKKAIFLLENADVATAHHEFFHVFFDMLPENVQKQVGPALEQLGIDINVEGLSPRALETVTRLYERYLADGEAPTPDMTSMFSILSKHMRSTYKKIMGSPISNRVSPEAKQFFDSLYVPDGKYTAPHAGYIQREEQEQYGMIEAYDKQNGVTRKDPQEIGAIAQDIGRLRHELGVNVVNMDVAARAASGLPIGTVSYRAGRKVYRKLLRTLLSENVPLDDAFLDQLPASWVRSGSAQGNKTLQTLSEALRADGIEPRDVNRILAKVIEQYAKTKQVPPALQDFKRQVGQTTRGFKAWVKDATDNVAATRRQRGFSESGVLTALVDGDLALARRVARQGTSVDGVTNALGGYNRHQGEQFSGGTVGQTKDVRTKGHKVLIPASHGADAGFFHSDTSLANSAHNGKPIRLYAYHKPSRQLIPAREGQLYERLTEMIPNSDPGDWVRVDVSGGGDLVGTSGQRSAQIEAYSALRATDPNIRWIPDAQQVVGFYNVDGTVLDNAQFTPDGAMGDYVVFPKDKLDLFQGNEPVATAAQLMDSPEFASWQRRVRGVVEPGSARDFFTGLDSAAIGDKARKKLKNDFMNAVDKVLGVEKINATNLESALPGKNNRTQRNMILAVDRGGSITDMVKHFNNLQDIQGLKTKIRGLDLTEANEVRGRFELGESEKAAAGAAADISGVNQQFFRDLIASGEVRFPDEAGTEGHQQMVRMLVHISKKRTGALARADEAQLDPSKARDGAARRSFFRLATNARYAWNRLGSEVGNLDIGRRFTKFTQTNRRGSRNVETRFAGFFHGENIKDALRRNGEAAPKGKLKDQLYEVIRAKDSQDAIARWLGTEPGDSKAFKQAQQDFKDLPPAHKGVGYLIREELQGTSAAHLRKMQHHVWSKAWESRRSEYMALKSKKKLNETDQARFVELSKELSDAAPFKRGATGEAERVSNDEMIDVHNQFLQRDDADFHEFLKAQNWGSRSNYWLTVRPEEYDKLLEQFTGRLDPLPTGPQDVKAQATGMPGSINPRTTQKVKLDTENILNNLFQHMHRYEILSNTQRDAEFLRDEVNKMEHLTPGEIKMLDRDIKNLQGFGDSLGPLQTLIAKSNRLFWKSYILNTQRLVWYTVRNKAQPYALAASQFPISEIVKAVPEWKSSARDPGSPLRKAFGEDFQSDILEGGAFARQALTDTSSDVSVVKGSAISHHFDTFMNTALPFSDKLNRQEVYGLGYTIASRALRDFEAGKIDEAGVMKRTGLLTLDPAEQLDLMSKFNSGDTEAFKREYARIKNLNINFAYRTGERALFLQDANTRTFASLSTWPLGATEIIVRNSIKPMIDGLTTGDKAMMVQGLKAFTGYVVGMYLVGEMYSLIFGDKGGKAYDPLFSAISPSIESPGQGWIRAMMDDGIDVMHKVVTEQDSDGIALAGEKIFNRAMYMTPQIPSLAGMYEAVADRKNVEVSDLLKSTALGFTDGVVDWMESGDVEGETTPGLVGLIGENISGRMARSGYSEYRTGWEGVMHFILGTFEESDPERWDRSVVGRTIHSAISEALEAGRKHMAEEEFEDASKKFKRTHNLDFGDFE
jgi:hypothetical protein